MLDILPLSYFGNPILRGVAQPLSVEDIRSDKIQLLIEQMRYTLEQKNYGVGIAAPQVGQSIALSVVGIKPTPNRPELEPFHSVLINPEFVEMQGEPIQKWEACISCGSSDNLLFAKVPRYETIRLRWLDETAVAREELLSGFVAHVAQHETDHLNGVLFVDRVTDTSSYMMADEYRKRIILG